MACNLSAFRALQPTHVAQTFVRRRALHASSTRASKAAFKLDKATGQILNQKKQPKFQTIIGLEIHAQLDIPTKLFSNGRVSSRERPNASLSGAIQPFDMAVPGFLPMVSKEAVQSAVLAAGILNCHIPRQSRFERKHYSYADLPSHYQITQQRWPLATNGSIEAIVTPERKKTQQSHVVHCRIDRIQLEQDTGKTSSGDTIVSSSGTQFQASRVDFNRAGQALIEIVMKPDLRSSIEAATVTETIRHLLKHVGVCDGRMDEGSLRCDVNVNIEKIPSTDDFDSSQAKRSPRVEVKNLNSIRQVRDAVEYEVLRQAKEWENQGSEASAETRTWDRVKRKTVLIRKKNEEQDYRFLPEPDLPPLVLDEDILDGSDIDTFLKSRKPELPADAITRFQQEYNLSDFLARVIASDPPAIAFFDEAVQVAKSNVTKDMSTQDVAVAVANFLCSHLVFLVKDRLESDEDEASMQDSLVNPSQLGQATALQLNGKLSKPMTKKILSILFLEEIGGDPSSVAADRGMELISDPGKLRDICLQAIEQHPDHFAMYQKGGKFEKRALKIFAGKTMDLSHRNADPERLREILAATLEERSDKSDK